VTSNKCIVGLEVIAADPSLANNWGRCGLVCNQASVTANVIPAWEILAKILDKRLVSLFGPQHGFYGTKQDNMIESGHAIHPTYGVPLYSLYSETREPTPEMLSSLDTLIIDLQITGCRVYTWKATIAACMRAAKKLNKKVVILDRPNPLGGEICEGRVLDADCKSFVGEYPIPMRHGLTAAEAARFFNSFIGCELEVVELQNWDPRSYWGELERPWILTSPNLPTVEPVYVYPGTVLFEGTNVSEGRGTGLPFQFIGAPYLESPSFFRKKVLDILDGQLPGIHLREAQFEPTSQKWAGQTCYGVQIHVQDFRRVRSLDLSIALLRACVELGANDFAWKSPPYEYDFVTLPIKLIFGSQKTDQKFFAKDFSIHDIFWHEGIENYIQAASKCLLYDRDLSGPR
jgi:uncharacterized protein YbbC (DUF1343 family)